MDATLHTWQIFALLISSVDFKKKRTAFEKIYFAVDRQKCFIH